MKPVVPKVRVGDVLHGTKNLRNYLRTCSLIRYFKSLELSPTRASEKQAKSLLYTPNKQDEFVVAVNSSGRFCVWSTNMDVIMIFKNSEKSSSPHPDAVRMDPSIFAQWFVRTSGRRPVVRQWPLQAHYLWGALQINAQINPETRLPVAGLGGTPTEDVPFCYTASLPIRKVDRATIQHAVMESIAYGSFRNLPRAKKNVPMPYPGAGTGPNLKSLPALRADLKNLLRNPRLVARAKKESGLDFSFLEHLQNDPQ